MAISKYFFTHLVSKYLKSFKYDFEDESYVLRELTHINNDDCERWAKLPPSMLNKFECLCMGIKLVFNGEKVELFNFDKAWAYLESGREQLYINRAPDDKLKELYDLTQGILCLQKAIESNDFSTQQKLLKVSRSFFDGRKTKSNELFLLHLMLVEVALENLPSGIRYLGKASKVSSSPVVLLRGLENIYKSMNMKNVAEFFSNRAQNELSLSL